MSFDAFEGPRDTFALHGQRAIQIQSDGLYHPRSPGRNAPSEFTPFEDITHVATTSRAFWLATTGSAYAVGRRSFVDPHGPEKLVRALLAVLAHRPGGQTQLARMAEVERVSMQAPPPRVTWLVAAVCTVVYGLQLALGRTVMQAGYYSRALVEDGDFWRLLTANVLHGPWFHFGLNLLALLALGNLVERPLGHTRTACVLGAAALSSMAMSGLAGETGVVGASGMVLGLAGSVLWLEYTWTERLPAWWRFPRRALLGFLALNVAITLLVPFIARGAHVGGFAGGLVATAIVSRLPARNGPARWVPRVLASALAGLFVVSMAAAGRDLLRGGSEVSRLAARIAALPGVSPGELNDIAWTIAIAQDSTREEYEAALALAERAVRETGRSSAAILDTLAEVQFQLGRHEEAVGTIDEAIARAPDEPYYRAQRERFTKQRPADDRPPPPSLWPTPRRPPPPEDEDRITV